MTYGTFRPGPDGSESHDPAMVERDFASMSAQGINAVRVYTVPPRWLLDLALHRGLRVMVGLPWEQHVAFLESAATAAAIEARVRAGVRSCAGHPAVLCYAIGNEIPSSIVRWYGRRRVEGFLRRLYRAAKSEDPAGLVTYVNYPSTEYLDLPFLDFACFNVYLESRQTLAAYVGRLQVLAGDRPLVMAEIGLDSRRHGLEAQAAALDWQIRTVFASGCAGAFAFAWTDEWHRGGFEIEDWDFGLTDRQRRPKPALDAVRRAFSEIPLAPGLPWPRISVVVCSFNGERTIRACCEALSRLDYPDYEVIVVDDGSTDRTAEIAGGFGFRVISTENQGLSSARNTGMRAASGEIVAYTDDDAPPDPHWLTFLAWGFMTTDHAAIGGPNVAPPGDGLIAGCVAHAPGGPVHVLLSDTVAEHVPGCNLAVRRRCLEAIGGFDPRYRAAGDDVDVCWRLQERGWTIGFSPGAMVWHHRRNSVRAYWKQQLGYGRAEALLEQKWPEKYNSLGHLTWQGRIYGNGIARALTSWRGRVYQGAFGSAPFQSIYHPAPGVIASLPLMPEWYGIIFALAAFSLLGLHWAPLAWCLVLLAAAAVPPIAQALLSAARARWASTPTSRRSRRERLGRFFLTAFLHLVQPLARLTGRLRHGLTPWRRPLPELAVVIPRTTTLWSETWRAPEDWLARIRETIAATGAVVLTGGEFDRWDLEARGGVLGSARLRTAIEEHGAGRQLLRVRSWPRLSSLGVLLGILLGVLAIAAADDEAWGAVVTLAGFALVLTSRIWVESASAVAVLRTSVREVGRAVASAQAVREPVAADFPAAEALETVGAPAAD
ncbi:MAG TPA: glycosyltransferase [Thermoanaerobaculia bacterium]|nr:glycosyltransferase [Thermoanaerobaculia bacterium]